MSRENPKTPEWAEFYRDNPNAIANWGETNGRTPTNLCPNTGRSASVCDTPDHRNCPVLDWKVTV